MTEGGKSVKDCKLNQINGKKIRRQYFNIPLIILYSLMFEIPYAVTVISICSGENDFYKLPELIWKSIWICFVFSLPILVLRILNKHCFGRIICVLSEEGIYYSNKAKIRWETIEKIEYVINSEPRYKGDTRKDFRVIVYTQGGKHIVLTNAPMCIVSDIKKYQKNIDIKFLGAKSLIPSVLGITLILLLSPFYAELLCRAPGPSIAQGAVLVIIATLFYVIRNIIFDTYFIQYRFWRKILPKKWLSYIILAFYYSSGFVALLVLCYFPNWVTVSFVGIFLGILHPPIPSKHNNGHFDLMSYNKLYEIYIDNADFWEESIEKNKIKRAKKK